MARDATARLYDVDEDTLLFKKFRQSEKYDIGTITFRAKQGKTIDLAKLHESIWATRLSGGTRSGVISLQVSAVGVARQRDGETIFEVTETGQHFVLVDDIPGRPQDAPRAKLKDLREALSQGVNVSGVVGYVAGWSGRWPDVLKRPPADVPQLMVTDFRTSGE